MNGEIRKYRIWSGVKGMSGKMSTMWAYKAEEGKNTGIAVVIFPGGSYSHTMGIATEGFEVARWLSSHGINAFVVRYRTSHLLSHHPAMIQDAQRAIQLVRENAEEYGVDPDKLGVMGFSAGGHLSMMCAEFVGEDYLKDLGVEHSCPLDPAFAVGVYPVISMQDEIVHTRSRRNLLTRHYTPEQKERFSMERSIPEGMVPVFLTACKDDRNVNCQNSIWMDKALTQKNIDHKFLLYDKGNHGYGGSETRAPEAAKWKYEFLDWIMKMFEK